jgi:hypothetical protein
VLWTPVERIVFRFVSIYVVLYFFPVPEDFLPGARWLIAAWAKVLLGATPWVCRTVIGVSCDAPTADDVNGDTAADSHGWASVTKMNDTRRGIACNAEQKTCTLTEAGGVKIELSYDQPERDRLVIQGTVGDEALVIQLTRIDESSFPLLRKRFRWIER